LGIGMGIRGCMALHWELYHGVIFEAYFGCLLLRWALDDEHIA